MGLNEPVDLHLTLKLFILLQRKYLYPIKWNNFTKQGKDQGCEIE